MRRQLAFNAVAVKIDESEQLDGPRGPIKRGVCEVIHGGRCGKNGEKIANFGGNAKYGSCPEGRAFLWEGLSTPRRTPALQIGPSPRRLFCVQGRLTYRPLPSLYENCSGHIAKVQSHTSKISQGRTAAATIWGLAYLPTFPPPPDSIWTWRQTQGMLTIAIITVIVRDAAVISQRPVSSRTSLPRIHNAAGWRLKIQFNRHVHRRD